MKRLVKSLNLRAERVKAAPLSADDSPAPDMKKRKPARRRRTVSSRPSKTEIHIHGDVSGSNIVIGGDNRVKNNTDA